MLVDMMFMEPWIYVDDPDGHGFDPIGALVADDGSLLSHEDPDDVVEPMMLAQ